MRLFNFGLLLVGLFYVTVVSGTSATPKLKTPRQRKKKNVVPRKVVPRSLRNGGFGPNAKIWKPPKDYEMFKAITSPGKTLADHAGLDFYGKRQEATERLLEIVKSRKTPDGKKVSAEYYARCIDFLGFYFRARTAVRPLVKMMAHRPKGYWPSYNVGSSGLGQPYQFYPAAAALVEIGQPAVRRVLYFIADKKTTSFERKLAVWVLLRIEHLGHTDFITEESHASVKRVVVWRLKNLGKGPRIDEAVAFVKSYKPQIGAPEKVRGFLPKSRLDGR